MSDEKRAEIIKALAYGLDETTVAECNGVSADDVHTIATERSAQVIAMRTELEEVYPDAF